MRGGADTVARRFEVEATFGHVEVELTETATGGQTRTRRFVKDRHSVETVLVEVDLAGLARLLGTKAVHSAGGKAVEAGGLVVVRHVRVKR